MGIRGCASRHPQRHLPDTDRHRCRSSTRVNHAGFGRATAFDASSLDDEQQLLNRLVTATTRPVHAALGLTLESHAGTIVNIASVAGFTPRRGTRGAVKAGILRFSRWATIAYRGRRVTATAVAPGFARTEFHDRMTVATDGISSLLWLDAPTLVRLEPRDVEHGRAVSVPTVRDKLVALIAGLLPNRIVAARGLRGR